MIIGTDSSLAECRAEGYMMIEFNKRSLVKKRVLQQDCYVRAFRTRGYLPHNEEGKPPYVTDTLISWADAVAIYISHKNALDNFVGTNKIINFENPSVHDLLQLLSDIDAHCGLG